ncbi:MAG: S41 family peptidase [Patescibacteria group bacterium]
MLKISFANFRKSIVYFVIGIALFSGGYFLGLRGYRVQLENAKKITVVRELPPDKSDVDFSLFWKVWDTLQTSYFDKSKINQKNMVYGAIQGMVSAVGDPYTVFLPPNDNKVVNEDLSGSFEGVGIEIGFRGNQLTVISPLPDSPAQKAGIKAGDFIVGIKDEAKKIDRGTVGMSLTEAVKIIRGEAGSQVTLLLTRDGMQEQILINVERAKLDIPSVTLDYVGKDNDVVHLRIIKFGGATLTEWDKTVNQIVANKDTKGIVLDLRNNPGGYLEASVNIAGEFLKTGSVGVIEEDANSKKTEFKTQRIGKLTKIPLVVLVNGGSASASEILAGALRDNKRAKVVGEKTFGKGSIQEPIDFKGGSGIHLTIARWLTPSGIWVNEKGLTPDIEIKFDETGKTDNQLEEAIKLL